MSDQPPEDDPEAAVVLPITDVLDLHSFRPAEVPDVVRDYLDAAYERGLRELRIIHGRGAGVQRATVRRLLAARSPGRGLRRRAARGRRLGCHVAADEVAHFLLSALRGRHVRLVHGRRYVLDLPGAHSDPLRGERILVWLRRERLLRRRQVLAARPLTLKALRRVHDDAYLERLRDRRRWCPSSASRSIAELGASFLAAARAQCGGTLAAARWALAHRGVGGQPRRRLPPRPPRPRRRLLRLQRRGRRDRRAARRGLPRPRPGRRPRPPRRRRHARALRRRPERPHAVDPQPLVGRARRRSSRPASSWATASRTAAYLAALDATLPPLFARFAPELVVYLAGADVAAGDRLGNWRLSPAGRAGARPAGDRAGPPRERAAAARLAARRRLRPRGLAPRARALSAGCSAAASSSRRPPPRSPSLRYRELGQRSLAGRAGGRRGRRLGAHAGRPRPRRRGAPAGGSSAR